ncbi:MAG: TPM domain-containing protein [Fimbriimonadales bacterium]|nr:TPM domain-containing protein [Fimbriimonadales bacterium]
MSRWKLCRAVALCISGAILLYSTSWSQPLDAIPNPRQLDGGWVVDMAGVLDAPRKAQLNRLISMLERETGAEIAVVILRRTQGATPKEYATELFNRWGVGKRGADNGVLMLVALGDRRVEVETGYGMEAILPDAVVGAILDTEVVPRFRAGDIPGGMLAGVQAIAERIRTAQATGAYEPPATAPYLAPSGSPTHATPESPPIVVPLGIVLLGAGMILLLVYVLRERPPRCPTCNQPMRLLDEDSDDAYLNELQRTEERLGSVNYHVWRCEPCATLEVLPKVALFHPYSECPECGGRTVYETARIVRKPTYRRTGLELVAYKCKNPRCGYRLEQERTLPRLERYDDEWRAVGWAIGSVLGDSLSSAGSRSAVGGFSSGSSSGGSSFGGGSSGGGGAGRGW